MAKKKEVKPVEKKLGRPTLYTEEITEKLNEYFSGPFSIERTRQVITKQGDVIEVNETVPAEYKTKAKFALDNNLDRDTLQEWAKIHPTFSVAYKKATLWQEHYLVNNGLSGSVEQPMAIFVLKNNVGYKDKQEIEANVKSENKHEISTVDVKDRVNLIKGKE